MSMSRNERESVINEANNSLKTRGGAGENLPNRFLIHASRQRSNCRARLIELHKVMKSLTHFIKCKFSEKKTFVLRRSLHACCSHRGAMVVEVSTCQKDFRNLALSMLGRRGEKLWRTAEEQKAKLSPHANWNS